MRRSRAAKRVRRGKRGLSEKVNSVDKGTCQLSEACWKWTIDAGIKERATLYRGSGLRRDQYIESTFMI